MDMVWQGYIVFSRLCYSCFLITAFKKRFLERDTILSKYSCLCIMESDDYGGIEAIWGLRQLFGFSASGHLQYVLTGSFLIWSVCWIFGDGIANLSASVYKHCWLEAGELFSENGKVSCGSYRFSDSLYVAGYYEPFG